MELKRLCDFLEIIPIEYVLLRNSIQRLTFHVVLNLYTLGKMIRQLEYLIIVM